MDRERGRGPGMPHVEPRDGARRHIRVVLDRRWKGRGWFFSVPVALFGRQRFEKNLQKTLDVLASSR
jgi:hypothetical protein